MSPQRRPTLRTQWLGSQLRNLRDTNDMKLKEVAQYIRRDLTAVSRMENGMLPIPSADVATLLDLYGIADQARRDAIVRFSQDAWRPDWWAGYADEIEETVIDLVWLEQRAVELREFKLGVVPGLLQTPEYARALIREADPDEPAHQVERWVELRMQRQPILTRAEPMHLTVVLGEEVLRRPIGGAEVMAAQLTYLVERAARPNVTLRVLPYAAGAHPSPDGEFSIFLMPDDFSEVVCVDGAGGLIFIEPPRTSRYLERYDRLLDKTLEPTESSDFVRAVVNELEQG